MNYQFSIESFAIGLLLLIAGIIFLRWHRSFANHLGKGIADYDKFKLWALITCAIGFIVTLNLHVFIIGLIVQAVFKKS